MTCHYCNEEPCACKAWGPAMGEADEAADASEIPSGAELRDNDREIK